jgi:protein-tyrosine phosphatase
VVCHGNICRSPLAAAVLQEHLPTHAILSRGLGPVENKPAAKKIREFASTHGYDLKQHRSKVATQEEIQNAYLILYMDNSNRKKLEQYSTRASVVCLGSYLGLNRIPDPNYMSRGEELDRLLQQIVQAAILAASAIKNRQV